MTTVVTCPVCRVLSVEVTISRAGPRPFVYALEEFEALSCECSESPLVDRARYVDALLEAAA
jgi:hypothetical protein